MSQNKNMNIFNVLNIDSDEESTNMKVAKDAVKEVTKEVTKKKQRQFDESLFTIKTEEQESSNFDQNSRMDLNEKKKSSARKERKKKGNITRFTIAPKSFGQERREKFIERRQQQQEQQYQEKMDRNLAFEILSDKESLSKIQRKTRMCRTVDSGEPCPHGLEKCNFAHSFSELSFSHCLFKDRCNLVRFNDSNKLVNDGGKKVCMHKHQGESEEEFLVRTNLIRYRNLVPQQPPNQVQAQPTKQDSFSYFSSENFFTKQPILQPQPQPIMQPQPQPIKQVQSQPVEQETVLHVPKALAMQAIQLAMQSGRTNIRVEVSYS